MEKKSLALVQTRLEPNVYRWVSKAAKSEGLSIASYLRRLLILESRRNQEPEEAS